MREGKQNLGCFCEPKVMPRASKLSNQNLLHVLEPKENQLVTRDCWICQGTRCAIEGNIQCLKRVVHCIGLYKGIIFH